MAVIYERIVAEDLNLGNGTVSVTQPTGGTATGTQIGLHTFTPNIYSAASYAAGDDATDDGDNFSTMIAAVPDGSVIDLAGQTYRIATRVVFTAKNLTFRNGTITFINPNAGGQLACNPGTNCRLVFDHVTFQGTPVRASNSGGSDIVNKWLDLRSFECVTFAHCLFTSSGFTTTNAQAASDLVYLRYNTEVVFDGIVFENIDSDGLLVIGALDCTAPAGRVSCRDSLFKIADSAHAASGLNLANVKHLVFTGNRTIQATRATNTSSGHNLGADSAIVDGNLFQGCEKAYDFDLGAASLTDFIQYQHSHVCSNNQFIDCKYGVISNSETGDATHSSTLFSAYDVVISGNVFSLTSAIASSFGCILKPGRSTVISGNTFSRVATGLQLDFEDTLANDPNGNAARSAIIGEYAVQISGNTFDNLGVSSGNYGVAMLLNNMVDASSGLSRFNLSIDGNTFNTYTSASSSGLIYLTSLSNTSRLHFSLTNNTFYHLYSLFTMGSAFVGSVTLRGNTFDTNVASAQILSSVEANPILFAPHTIHVDSNHFKFSAANNCVVLNEQAAAVGSGPARYLFTNNLIELFSGYTDTSSLGPWLHNQSQAASVYTILQQNNRVVNVSATVAAIVAFHAKQPKAALFLGNYASGCARGYNVETLQDTHLDGNIADACIKGFILGTGTGTGTAARSSVTNNKAYDATSVMTHGFDCSTWRRPDQIAVAMNFCVNASTTNMDFGALFGAFQLGTGHIG